MNIFRFIFTLWSLINNKKKKQINKLNNSLATAQSKCYITSLNVILFELFKIFHFTYKFA